MSVNLTTRFAWLVGVVLTLFLLLGSITLGLASPTTKPDSDASSSSCKKKFRLHTSNDASIGCPQDACLRPRYTFGDVFGPMALSLFPPSVYHSTLPPALLVLVRNYASFNLNENRCLGSLGVHAAQELILILLRSTGFGLNRLDPTSYHYLDEFPGVFLRDTCSSPLLTSYEVNSVLRNHVYSTQTAYLSRTITPWFVIGPALSDEVAIVSPALSAQQISHLSFRATSRIFEDTNQFPFLFRTIPSDRYQARAIGDLFNYFNWTYVGIAASGDTYGLGGLDSLRQEAAGRNVCIGLEESFSADDGRNLEQIQDIVERFASDESMNALVLFALEHEARSFLSCLLAADIGRNYTIVAGEDWITRVNLRDVTLNSKCVRGKQKRDNLPHVIGYFPWTIGDKNLALSANISVDAEVVYNLTSIMPWISPYISNLANCSILLETGVKFNNTCAKSDSSCQGFNLTAPSWDLPPCKWQKASQAVHLRPLLLLSDAISRSIDRIRGMAASVSTGAAADILKKLKLPCSTEEAKLFPPNLKNYSAAGGWECRVFTPDQSAFPLYHLIHLNPDNVAGMEFQYVGKWQNISAGDTLESRLTVRGLESMTFVPSGCSKTCPSGSERVATSSAIAPCSFVCSACRSCSDYAITVNETCQTCNFSTTYSTVPNPNFTTCVAIVPVGTAAGQWYSGGTTAAACIAALLYIFTIVMFWWHQDKRVVRTADVKLSSFVLSGFVLGALSAIVLLIEPTGSNCIIGHLVSAPWVNFGTASMLAKISRIKHIFSKKSLRRGAEQSFYTKLEFQILLICLLVLGSFVISVVFAVVDPPAVATIVLDRRNVEMYCHISLPEDIAISIYTDVLILVVFAMTFKSRNVPEMYNESYHVFISTFGSLMLIFSLTTFRFVSVTKTVLPLLVAISIELQFLMIWVCVFAPRLYHLLRMVLLKEAEPDHRIPSTSNSLGRSDSFNMRLDKRQSFHLRRLAIDRGQPYHENLSRPPKELLEAKNQELITSSETVLSLVTSEKDDILPIIGTGLSDRVNENSITISSSSDTVSKNSTTSSGSSSADVSSGDALPPGPVKNVKEEAVSVVVSPSDSLPPESVENAAEEPIISVIIDQI